MGVFSRLYYTLKAFFKYHAYCTKPASFITVLVFGYSFVNHAVVGVLVSYLTSRSEKDDLLSPVIIANVQEGLASVLVIVVAHVADAHLGQLRMSIISSMSYVVGLLLLWVLNKADKLGYEALMMVVVLIALGQAGREPTLKSLLAHQLRNVDQSKDTDEEKKVEARTTFLWRIFRSAGAVVATLSLSFINPAWGLRFGLSTAVFGSGFFIFLSGYRFYRQKGLTGTPLTTVFHVFIAAMTKRDLPRSDDPDNYYKNVDVDKQLPLMPDIYFFRWLDKAALVETSTSLSPEQQEQMWKLCTVTQVKNVKLLLRMSPLWATFFVYSLVSAAGSTFFFEQHSKLNDQIDIGFYIQVPLTLFYVIQKTSGSAISSLYELMIPKSWSTEKKLGATKLRMGVGMVCSCLCCVAAWLVENRRLKTIARYDKKELENGNSTNMSIFWLTPQFCLLGFMEGLAEDGLYYFFHYQVVESMWLYGPSFNEFVLGIGKFTSILFMVVFKSWFGDTIDESKVNNYYAVLALASLGNIFIFSLVSKFVYKDAKERKKNTVDKMEETGKRIISIEKKSQETHPEGDQISET